MIKTTFYVVLSFTLLTTVTGKGQGSQADSTQKRINYSVSLSGLAATDKTPFWLRANQFGTVPIENPSFLPGVSLGSAYVSGRKWDWGFNVEAIGNIGKRSSILLPEAHVKGRWGKLELLAGRKRQIIGLVGDTLNTSGSYIQSGNALPIPMIQLGLTDYVPVLNNLLAFRGSFAHGWFDSNPITKDHYLHQKSFYLRFGKPSWPIRLYGGFNHSVQWGGKIVTPNKWTAPGQTSYPAKWVDYWYVVSGKRIPTFGYVDPNDYDALDRGNRVGNHLGSLDFAVEIKTNASKLTIYKQFVYDDGSLAQFTNLADGLYGISLRSGGNNGNFFAINSVALEYLYTRSQGGSTLDLNGGLRGADNYFNHMQYYGWVYQSNTIGTPFIAPKYQVRETLPTHPSINELFSNNNRIAALYLGVSGVISRFYFHLKLSHSKNYGLYQLPFSSEVNQFSGLLQLSTPLPSRILGDNLTASIALANDSGELFHNSTGVYLSIRKAGFF